MKKAMRATGAAALAMAATSGCLTTIDLSLLDGSVGRDAPAEDRCASGAGSVSCADAGAGPCPVGMVEIPSISPFCIDRTEVTNSAYAAFLEAAGGNTTGQPSFCRWNDVYTPSAWPFQAGEENHPVVGIDWCDALAHCTRARKRLCGRVGGGACPVESVVTASISQWYAACSAGGARTYPYGDAYEPTACNGDRRVGAPVETGSFPICSGGYDGLLDMSGNVAEWIDACSPGPGASGANDECLAIGGSATEAPDRIACKMSASSDRRSRSQPERGFRCCSP